MPSVALDELDPFFLAWVPDHAAITCDAGMARVAPTRFDNPYATGWDGLASIRPGFLLSTADVAYHESGLTRFPSNDLLKLHIRLSGENMISAEGIAESGINSGRMSFLVEPDCKVKSSQLPPRTRIRGVTLIFSREFLAPLLSPVHTPAALLDFAKAPGNRYAYRDAAISPAMRLIAEQLMELPDDPLSPLMMEAKALELLYRWLKALSAARDAEPLTPRMRRRTEALKELLHTPAGRAMTVAQLSRELAWNETQMIQSFKHVTGETISDYRHRLQMEQALAQLRNSDRSITEIAFEAGYEHPGNFATAFKRSFGVSPRLARSL
jgi:AraC-like DNA-binding protein